MCELINEMPKKVKKRGGKKTREILNIIKIEETLDVKKPYRFRMLFFKNPEINEREEPFVVKYTHEKSGIGEDGKRTYDFVNCPRTPYINWETNPFETCPMCATAGRYFDTYKDGGYVDKQAQRDFDKHKAKRLVMIPVFIIQDPNHPENNNKCGVLKIRESDFSYLKDEETGKWTTIDPYEVLEKAIDTSVSNGVFPFNTNGVDLLMTVKKISVSENVDKPFSYDKINKIALGRKSYEVGGITSDGAFNKFSKIFDEECFTGVTKEELVRFYDKNIGITYDVPDEDLGDLADDEPVPTPSTKPKSVDKKVEKPVEKPVEDEIPMEFDDSDLDELDMDDIIDDVIEDEKKPEVKEEVKKETSDGGLDDLDDLDDFLDDLDDI